MYKLRKGRVVIKQKKIVEITPDPLETKSNKRKRFCKKKEEDEDEDEDEDVGISLSGICCVKNRHDMKIFEEKEDCFILDFDPNDSFNVEKLSSTSDNLDGDDDVAIIHEKGEVACRDFPHSRHLCSTYPFGSTQHAIHCTQCFCYVCESAAPCAFWTTHCEAFEDNEWKQERMYHRDLAEKLVANNK